MSQHSKPLKTEQSKDLTPQAGQPLAGPELQNLVGDIRTMIESARGRVAQAVNAGLVMLYWSIGRRIRQDILKSRRAGYGEKIVSSRFFPIQRLSQHC